MFNPDPKIELIPIPGHHPCVVIDDFLLNPEGLVEFAAASRDSFVQAAYNTYPGQAMSMPSEYSRWLGDFFMHHVGPRLDAAAIVDLYCRLSMVTLRPEDLGPLQRICHYDKLTTDPRMQAVASVLFLFRDSAFGGTSFYVPKIPKDDLNQLLLDWMNVPKEEFSKITGTEPGYMTASNDYFELVCTIPAKWNRAIFYDGTIFHSGHITAPRHLNPDPLHGRLTLNSFLVCQRPAVAEPVVSQRTV